VAAIGGWSARLLHCQSVRTSRPRHASLQGGPVAKPNYSFEKRQRELAKKKKKEEKAQRKLAKSSAPGDVPAESPSDAPAPAGAGDAAGSN